MEDNLYMKYCLYIIQTSLVFVGAKEKNNEGTSHKNNVYL